MHHQEEGEDREKGGGWVASNVEGGVLDLIGIGYGALCEQARGSREKKMGRHTQLLEFFKIYFNDFLLNEVASNCLGGKDLFRGTLRNLLGCECIQETKTSSLFHS